MSSHINDLRSSGALVVGLYPADLAASTNGSTVDLGAIDGDGPCFAVQIVGGLDDEGTLNGVVQQSADGSSWSAISGAAFEEVDAANNLQTIRFTRTQRYVRWVGTIAGASPVFFTAALFGAQKKTF